MPSAGHQHSAVFERCLGHLNQGSDPGKRYSSVGKGYGDGLLYFLGDAIEKEVYDPECAQCREMAGFVLKEMKWRLSKAAEKWNDTVPWYNDRVTETFISSESIDKQGDSVAVDAVVETLPWLSKYGYYSWQHTDFPAGKIIGWTVRDEKPLIKVGWHDTEHSKIELHDQIWDYVKKNGYRGGSSIKGFPNLQKRIREHGKAGYVNRVEDLGLYHVAYTDSPANPDATMEAINTVAKAISKAMVAKAEPCGDCGEVVAKISTWAKSAREVVEKYGGMTSASPGVKNPEFGGKRKKMKLKKSQLERIRDVLKKEMQSMRTVEFASDDIDLGSGAMPMGRVMGEGVDIPGNPGMAPGAPVETQAKSPKSKPVDMSTGARISDNIFVAPTPGMSKADSIYTDMTGGPKGGPQSGSGVDPKVTGEKVNAPGAPAGPSKAERPATRRITSDQKVTMPQPAASQLSARPKTGGIEEAGDVSVGPGTEEVDTGGANTGSTSMFANSTTDSPVMTAIRKEATDNIVGALLRSAYDMRGTGGVVYPDTMRKVVSKAGDDTAGQDPGTMNQQPQAQKPEAAKPPEQAPDEGDDKDILIEILDLLQDLMPGTQEAAREVAEGAQELKEQVASETPEGAPSTPAQEPAKPPEAAGAEAKGMTEETPEQLRAKIAELEKQVKTLSKPTTSPMSPVVDNTPGPAGRVGYGEIREIVSKAANGNPSAMADYWSKTRFVRVGERKMGNPILPPIPNSELLSMEAKIKALSAGTHKE